MVNHFGLEEGGWSWRTERRNKRVESCCRAGWGEGSRQPCRGVAVSGPALPTATQGWAKESGFLEWGKWWFLFLRLIEPWGRRLEAGEETDEKTPGRRSKIHRSFSWRRGPKQGEPWPDWEGGFSFPLPPALPQCQWWFQLSRGWPPPPPPPPPRPPLLSASW